MSDGQEVSLAYPRTDDAAIERIAHHLSTINRFTGGACRPYSVAEHSLLVADIARDHLMLDAHGQLAALMHDAHEAYTNDQSTPSKHEIGPGWDIFEERFADLVATRFQFRSARLCYQREVRAADRIALATERCQLLPNTQPCGTPSTPWPVLARVAPASVDLLSPERDAMTWRQWRDAFINRFVALDAERRQTKPSITHALHITSEAL